MLEQLTWFLRLFESEKSRNIRLARERARSRAERRRDEEALAAERDAQRRDLRNGHNVWHNHLAK